MIRPTMSHAVNKNHFIELLSKYATELEQEVKELKALNQKFKDGVHHFNRSHGDMNPLLTAVIESPSRALAQHDKEVAIEAIEELKHRIIECREMELSQGDVYTIDLIAEQFKQGFDVFETPDAV